MCWGLEQRAVVKESLRLSYGIPGRIPRVVPPEGATFCGEHIPPGVSCSFHIRLAIYGNATSDIFLGCPGSRRIEHLRASYEP